MACYQRQMPNSNRTYRNIRERFNELTRRDRQRSIRSSISSSSSSAPTESDEDTDTDDEVFPVVTTATTGPRSAIQVFSLKRRIDQVEGDRLDRMEADLKELTEAITKRRKTIEEEAERKRKEEELKVNDDRKCSCCVCHLDIDGTVMSTICGHTMCLECSTNLLTMPLSYYGQRHHSCPACRAELNGTGTLFPLPEGTTMGGVYVAAKEAKVQKAKRQAQDDRQAEEHQARVVAGLQRAY